MFGNNFVRTARKALNYKLFLQREYEKSKGQQTSLRDLSDGFFTVSKEIYNFTENNPKNYLTDWARIHRASKINGKQKIILDDKILFHSAETNNPAVLSLLFL